MVEINYSLLNEVQGFLSGYFVWEMKEDFSELIGKSFELKEMSATDISNIPNMGEVSKILLSGIAGSVIQHMLSSGFSWDVVFEQGTFNVANR